MYSVEFRGITLYVEGDYQPEEPEVRYDSNMEGYPGCSESFTVNRVFIENTDVTDFMENYMEEIEQLVIETIKE